MIIVIIKIHHIEIKEAVQQTAGWSRTTVTTGGPAIKSCRPLKAGVLIPVNIVDV